MRLSAVTELFALQVDRGDVVPLAPVVLRVLPLGLVAAFRQQVHAAHQVVGVEVVRIHPRQDLHPLVLAPQRDVDAAFAYLEAHAQSRTLETEDSKEGIKALLDKRPPVFKNR